LLSRSDCVAELDAHADSIRTMLEETRAMQVSLKQLTGQFESVEGNALTLQTSCESLLEQQVDFRTFWLTRSKTTLAQRADAIESILTNFDELERITKLMNAPGDQVCADDMFLPTMIRLEECFDFVHQHVRISMMLFAD
jgi:hypothetical protein